LAQLIERVGGLTTDAYLYGTEFTRESVRRQQQENLDQLSRRLEMQSQSAGATMMANLPADRSAQAGNLQQLQQAQFQAQIARLRTMKSKCRVALDLNLQANLTKDLPSVVLEDGDAVFVPTKPAFVAVVGSVNNDNFFLYKSGKTIGEIVAAAGLNEEAEPKEMFLVRADGSVVSRKSFGWFSSFEGLHLMPGDTIVVPARLDRETSYNFWVRALKDWTQIFSNLGLGAAAIKTLSN